MTFDPNKYVYLDYAATSPLREEVLEAMLPYMQQGRNAAAFAMNPNSLHTPGREAFKALEDARRSIARSLKAPRPNQIIFTSGATEADNAALAGISLAAACKRGLEPSSSATAGAESKPHIITTAIEHDAVISCAKRLKQDGFDITYLKPDSNGFIEPEALEDAIKSNTVLVSIQMANSETGAIQPIAQLVEIAHFHGAYFHTDATQALGKTEVRLDELGVDAASFSAHKIYGPRGIGALYLGKATPFRPLLYGGGQEGGQRSGTQDVASAVGFAKACEIAVAQMKDERGRLISLRDKLYSELSACENVRLTVNPKPESLDYLCNIVNFMIRGVESETSVIRFDSLGFAVSGGSACSSKSLDASHVLLAMGIRPDDALGEVRVSMGAYTTDEDIEAFLAALPKVLNWG